MSSLGARSTRALIALATALLPVVALVLPVASPSIAANRLECGSTITRSITLTRDLVACEGPALVIGADGITVDLDGHLLRGARFVTFEQCEEDGPDSWTCTPCDQEGYPDCGPPFDTPTGFVNEVVGPQPGGAIVNDGYDDVTVRQGRVANYHDSVAATRVSGLVVRSVRGGSFGVNLELAHQARVARVDVLHATRMTNSRVRGTAKMLLEHSRRNRISGNPGDIWLFDGSNNNVVVDNVTTGFKVIWMAASHRNQVRRNHLHCDQCIVEPIFLSAGSTGNVIEDNTMSGMVDGAYGIVLFGADHNIVRNNTIGPALELRGFPQSGGILICSSDGNTISGNTILDTFVGIGVDNDVSCEEGGSHDNTISGNGIRRASGAGDFIEQTGDGITVGETAADTLVAGNVVRRSQHDGIDVASRTTTIRGNQVRRNGDLGIRAVPGVIDGGGNVATGNGDPRECLHVGCG